MINCGSPTASMDTFYNHPRIPVTPSTLFAYAHMRGPKINQADPLHDALYPAMSRILYPGRVILPASLKTAPMEGLPKGAMYFWDPLTVATDFSPYGESARQDDSGYSSSCPPEDSCSDFRQFKCKHPPQVSKNHYKGKDVWSNFGYVRINDKWVDPESTGELYKAYYNPSGGPNSKAELPQLDDYGVQAPKAITSQAEEDEFYKGYVADVVDEMDGEGDPRQFRISAATFARWATGATKGDIYEPKEPLPSSELPTQDFEDAINALPPKIKPTIQVDHDTGSVMSGEYSAPSSPILIQNPHGMVDMVRQPPYFQRSYARTALELEEQAFAACCKLIKPPKSTSSNASSPVEIFTNDGVFNYLQDRHGGHPVTEEQLEEEYMELEQNMSNLRNKKDEVIYKNLRIYEASKKAFEERLAMSQEVARLERELEAARTKSEFLQAIHLGPDSTYYQSYAMKQQQENDDRQQKEYARQDLEQHIRQNQTDYAQYLQSYQNRQLYEAYQWQAQVNAYHQAQLQAQAFDNPTTPPPAPRHQPNRGYRGRGQQEGVLDSPIAIYHSHEQSHTPPYREDEMYTVKSDKRTPIKRKIVYPSAVQPFLAQEQYQSPLITYGDFSETNSLHTQISAPSTPPPMEFNSYPYSQGNEEQNPTQVLSPCSVSSDTTVRPKKTHSKQYARHIDEAFARENMAIVRAEKMDERLNGDLRDILEELEDLRELKDILCGRLNEIGEEMNRGRIES